MQPWLVWYGLDSVRFVVLAPTGTPFDIVVQWWLEDRKAAGYDGLDPDAVQAELCSPSKKAGIFIIAD